MADGRSSPSLVLPQLPVKREFFLPVVTMCLLVLQVVVVVVVVNFSFRNKTK